MRWLFVALTFFLTTDLIAQPDPDHIFHLSGGDGLVDETALVYVAIENADPDEGWSSYSWGICHDTDLLAVEEDNVVEGVDFDEIDDFTLHVINYYDDGWTVAALMEVTIDQGFYEVYEITYDCLEIGRATVEFCETLGDPPDSVVILIDGDEVEPTIDDEGDVDIIEPPLFLRGDIDGNGEVSVLLDALELLEWGFTSGGEPPCMDAADVDDSGVVSALLDALALLAWGFADGNDPPDPGPEECGEDPTRGDDVECETFPLECLF